MVFNTCRPDSSEPFELVNPVTTFIITFPSPVDIGSIGLLDNINVEEFDVSFIDADGNVTPFQVCNSLHVAACFVITKKRFSLNITVALLH